MRSIGSIVGVVCFVLPLTAGSAQEPRRLAQPDSVPFELASALIGAGGLGGEPQILVGSLPGWVSGKLKPPANVTVLGSAFMGSIVVGILSTPDAPEVIIGAMKADLLKQGWQAPPPPPSYGGFRPAGAVMMYGGSPTSFTLCEDAQTITAAAMRRRGTRTEITVRITPAVGYSQCSQRTQVQVSRNYMPVLYNPSSTVMASCVGSYGGSGTSTQLTTTMSPTALLDHYAKQLADSGWHAVPGQMIGRTWTKTDSAGAPMEVTLSARTSPRDSTCQDISMQVRTNRP